jgi:hypothetical protein
MVHHEVPASLGTNRRFAHLRGHVVRLAADSSAFQYRTGSSFGPGPPGAELGKEGIALP